MHDFAQISIAICRGYRRLQRQSVFFFTYKNEENKPGNQLDKTNCTKKEKSRTSIRNRKKKNKRAKKNLTSNFLVYACLNFYSYPFFWRERERKKRSLTRKKVLGLLFICSKEKYIFTKEKKKVVTNSAFYSALSATIKKNGRKYMLTLMTPITQVTSLAENFSSFIIIYYSFVLFLAIFHRAEKYYFAFLLGR